MLYRIGGRYDMKKINNNTTPIKKSATQNTKRTRKIGSTALGRMATQYDGRGFYDEIMSGSIPERIHRQLLQTRLASA